MLVTSIVTVQLPDARRGLKRFALNLLHRKAAKEKEVAAEDLLGVQRVAEEDELALLYLIINF